MLELVNVSKVVGIKTVLNNINLKIGDGEAIALCGDVMGNRLLLKAMGGFLQLKRGVVEIDGAPIVEARGIANVGDISYISDKGTLFWNRKVKYSTDFRKKWYPGYNQADYERMEIDLGATSSPKERYCKMDKRERAIQVLAFGMSLGCKYWLIDSVICELEADKRRQVYEKIQHHCTKNGGVVLLMLSDDLICNEAEEYFSRLLYMKDGTIVGDDNLMDHTHDKALPKRIREWQKAGAL